MKVKTNIIAVAYSFEHKCHVDMVEVQFDSNLSPDEALALVWNSVSSIVPNGSIVSGIRVKDELNQFDFYSV